MRIYFDTNIFQALKQPENAELYQLFLGDAHDNVYCFSEAHIYDLVRDHSDQKLSDMAFMETLVTSNCWSYNKQLLFQKETPLDYYRRFDWTPTTSVFNEDNDLISLLRTTLSSVPLNFANLFNSANLPADIPESFKTLLTTNTTMFDFMLAFVEFSQELSSEQKEFKKLIRYLHEKSLTGKIYESMQIEGFDGEKVTDKEKFRTSFETYLMRGKSEVYRYDLFLSEHSGLELLGIVKGKPKKQKLQNMINDGRHAFFGAFCDFVVSKDADMIAKTKFLYGLHNIKTQVMTLEEFLRFRANESQHPDGFGAMMEELGHFDTLETIHEETDEKKVWVSKKMNHTYWTYFDCINYVINPEYSYSYFTKMYDTIPNWTLTQEITYVNNQAFEAFGPDVDGKKEFVENEIQDGKWPGRNWLIDGIGIQLFHKEKLTLAIFQGKLRDELEST